MVSRTTDHTSTITRPVAANRQAAIAPRLSKSLLLGTVASAVLGLVSPALAVDTSTFFQTVTLGDFNDYTYDDGDVHVTGIGSYGFYLEGTGADSDFDIGIKANVQSDDESAVFGLTTGDFKLTTEGNFASTKATIDLEAGGDITVDHTGDLVSWAEEGIHATTAGDVAATFEGDIDSLGDGIYVNSYGAGSTVGVDATGYIFSREGDGIEANANGPVTVAFTGNAVGTDIDALGDAIHANSYGPGAAVSVTVQGDLTSRENNGVYAKGASTVTVDLKDGSSVAATKDGVYADSFGGTVEVKGTDLTVSSAEGNGVYANASGAVTVSLTGRSSVTAESGTGNSAIFANSYGGGATVTLLGSFESKQGIGVNINAPGVVQLDIDAGSDVKGNDDAIHVNSYGASGGITADVAASVTSTDGTGIYLYGQGAISLTYAGNLQGKTGGITAQSYGDMKNVGVTVTSGSITATDGKGISAQAEVGDVTVTNNASIQSKSDGIFAKSLTAGYDGNSNGLTQDEWAGDISVTNSGTINTDNGYGIYALSNFHQTSVTNTGDITSYKDAIFAQSLGDYSDADVTVDNDAQLQSDTGNGIFAQSMFKSVVVDSTGNIGAKLAGISASSMGLTNSNTSVTNRGDIDAFDQQGIYARSTSGYVNIDTEGDITAKLDGIKALAYGNAAGADIDIRHSGSIVSYSGSGIYANATQNAVSITAAGDITSKNAGIYALATGDGTLPTVNIDYQSGNLLSYSGHGIDAKSTQSSVTVNNHGSIHTQGTGTDAIHAEANTTALNSRVVIGQYGTVTSDSGYGVYGYATEGGVTVTNAGSVNGKLGGIYASATGDVDDATIVVNNTGDIFTWDGAGIYGESDSETVTINHNGGTITGGAYGIQAVARTTTANVTVAEDAEVKDNNVAAILLDSNGGSFLTNYGTITGGPGLALQTKGYNGSTVHNHGVINGSVEFNAGISSFYNEIDGVYNIASLTSFSDATFYNSGTVSPGGSGDIAEAYLQSRYIQSANGVLLIDVDGTDADHLQVDGNAELDGKVQLNFLSTLVPAQINVLDSWWLDKRNLTLANLIVDADIRYVDDTDVVIDINGYDFSPDFAEQNGSSVGDALTEAYDAGNTEIEPILSALANLTTEEEYQEALNELSPEIVADTAAGQVTTNAIFTNKLFSCKVQDGAYKITAEGECTWFSVSGGKLSRDATDEAVGYSQTWTNLAAGNQWAIGEDLRFGVAVGYTRTDAETEANASTTGNSGEIGAVLKYDRDGLVIGGAVTAGVGATDSVRNVDFGGLDETITGSGNNSYVSARASFAYGFEYGDVYAKPMLDLDLTQINIGAYQEEGGAAAQSIDASSTFIATITPALEVGGEVAIKEDIVARGFFRVGAALSSGNDIEAKVRLAGSDDAYTVTSDMDNALLKVSAGVDVINSDNATLRVYYDGSFGETSRSNGVGFKLSGKLY